MSTFTTGSPQGAGVRDIEVNLLDCFPDGLAEFQFYNIMFALCACRFSGKLVYMKSAETLTRSGTRQ